MPTSNTTQESRPTDPIWHLLGEYSLRESLPDFENNDKGAAGILSEMVRESAIPIEGVENIEMTLRNLAREALVHFKQGSLELPGRIRIFCQKKMIEEKMRGGWGYFVIERSRDYSTEAWAEYHHFIDIYFYEEGK